jgi:hypothetical protein
LNHCQISRARHDAAECIHFADDSSLCDSANCRIARHLADGLECACYESNAAPRPGGRNGGFSTGVSRTDDKYVEL